MHNVVKLKPDRIEARPRLRPRETSARILFFTGVRYCRDEDADRPPAPAAPEPVRFQPNRSLELSV